MSGFIAALAAVHWAPIARTIASLDAVAFAGVGAWQLFTPTAGTAVGLSIYTICTSALIFLIELPLLCSCFKVCVAVMKYTKYIGGYWFARATLYGLIVAGAYAIYLVRRAAPRGMCA